MYNDLFSIGPLTIHTYGLMIGIGILAAYFTAEYRAEKKGLNPEMIFGLVIVCALMGFASSKLLYLITILPQVIEDPGLILSSLAGGWVVFGGILGGILGGYLYCRVRGLSTWDYFDLGLASVALAQGFGRIGCFFAGCCYGVETNGWYGIVFSHSNFAPNHVSLVPTQLLSSAFDFFLFFFLCYYDKRKKKHTGEITALYLILYSIGRFIIEFFRGDLIRGSVGVFSTSQFISIFVLIAGVVILIKRRKTEPVNSGKNMNEEE
jgi:phosphatidylglycerol:prolipoprotein diacylglycerol transferase